MGGPQRASGPGCRALGHPASSRAVGAWSRGRLRQLLWLLVNQLKDFGHGVARGASVGEPLALHT